MTQVHGQQGVIKTYSNARKLFQISTLPIGVMSYGVGNIGPRSIQSFMREFGSSASSKDVKGVTDSLLGFVKTAYDAHFDQTEQKPDLGFYVAGYSIGKVFAEEWEFRLPVDDKPKAVRPETGFGASWRGIAIPFTRLYRGYDPRIESDLRGLGLLTDPIEKALKRYESPIVFDGMPVQDALNFAVYVVRTTIGMATYEVGPPSCGGPLQVATILPDAGFKWIHDPQIAVQEQ
jgi:hypothetical protein